MTKKVGKSIKNLAATFGKSSESIIKTLKSRGIEKNSENDSISPLEIKILLGYTDTSTKQEISEEKLVLRTSAGVKRNVGVQIKRKKNKGPAHIPKSPPLAKETKAAEDAVKINNNKNDSEFVQKNVAKTTPIKDSKVTKKSQLEPKEAKKKEQKQPEQKQPEQKQPEQKQPEQKQPEQKQPEQKQPEQKQPEQKQPEQKQPEKLGTKINGKSGKGVLASSVASKESLKELTVSAEVTHKRNKRKLAQKTSIDKSTITSQAFSKPLTSKKKKVAIGESTTVSALANELAMKLSDLREVMDKLGLPNDGDSSLDQETAFLLVEELGHVAKALPKVKYFKNLDQAWVNDNELQLRPPVVSVMGHVDHGKTTLLDYLRSTKVADREAGGITQHIGAYQVDARKKKITFLDTPGHKAFSSIRSLSSKITDIIVLIVAADDGVNQQTKEVISLAKDFNVPMVVAINKIDKQESNPEKTIQELMRFDVLPDSYGGETQVVQISAKSGKNIDQLLDAILLQAEILEIKAPTTGLAKAIVIESNMVKSVGISATVIIQAGLLKVGDYVTCGPSFGRIRIIRSSNGESIKQAQLGMPVQLFGLGEILTPGNILAALKKESEARELAEMFAQEKDTEKNSIDSDDQGDDEDPFAAMENQPKITHNLIIKTDVQGTCAAIAEIIDAMETSELHIVLNKSGPITESDIKLAIATHSQIIAFNVRPEHMAKSLSAQKGVKINYYSVIYHIEEDLEKLLKDQSQIVDKDKVIGIAEVLEVFSSSKYGQAAGCIVKEGLIKRKNPIRVLRENIVIFEGELESLRRFKKDIDSVKSGIECGIAVKKYNDIKPKDMIEVFEKLD